MKIRTERLLLRDFVSEDWPAVYAYQNDPANVHYYPWSSRLETEVRSSVQRMIDLQNEQPRRKFQLAITLPGSGRLIGNCGIRRKAENDWEADIGYELDPAHWRNGYATEAARAMVDYGFRELGVHRISARCIAENVGSVGVLEGCGLRLEGRLRENEHFKDRWWDTLLYGLLRVEWEMAAGSPNLTSL